LWTVALDSEAGEGTGQVRALFWSSFLAALRSLSNTDYSGHMHTGYEQTLGISA